MLPLHIILLSGGVKFGYSSRWQVIIKEKAWGDLIMIKNTRKIIWVIIICLSTAVFMTGCPPLAQKPTDPQYVMPEEVVERPDLAPPDDVGYIQDTDNIRERVRNIEGVRNATLVLNNTRVIIGLTADPATNLSRGVIEDRVQADVFENNDGLQEVIVTTNPAMVARIRDIEYRINHGDTPGMYANELNDIAETVIRENRRTLIPEPEGGA